MKSSPDLYLGLMTGTSVDAIDAVILQIKDRHCLLLHTHSEALPPLLQAQIRSLFSSNSNEIETLLDVDRHLAENMASAVRALLSKAGLRAADITAIGSHGQTVRHRPERGATLQLGNTHLLAELCGIDVVADFRRRDIALGGQGAPLAPGFHEFFFAHSQSARCIVNIGGIANVSVLQPGQATRGFDCGPGNGLMDAWIQMHRHQEFDIDGDWARSGKVNDALLLALLGDAYFLLPPPKSCGKELFNLAWLQAHLSEHSISAVDVQATLCELTARSIALALGEQPGDIYCCGGGAFNIFLMQRLSALLPNRKVTSTLDLGMDPRWVEAATFAWLAHQFVHKLPGNLPSVTGARQPSPLGALFPAF